MTGQRKPCACGCGQLTSGKVDPRRRNEFIRYHYSPSGDKRRAAKISESLKGHPVSEETRLKISQSNTGKEPRIIVNGYAQIYVPDHPFANSHGRVPEHRLVIERVLGHYLDPALHVHHIDGDTLHNDEGNLCVLTNAEHQRLHRHEEQARRHG